MKIHIQDARIEWESNTEAVHQIRRQGKREVTDKFRRYGDAIAILDWTELCIISKIETLRQHLGAASRLLEFLKELANKYHITLFANATAYVPDEKIHSTEFLSQDQLEGWYKKHGFVLYKGRSGIVEIWYPSNPHSTVQQNPQVGPSPASATSWLER